MKVDFRPLDRVRVFLLSTPFAILTVALTVAVLFLPVALGRTRTEPLFGRFGNGSGGEWTVFIERLGAELSSVCSAERPPLVLFTDAEMGVADLHARGLLDGLECPVQRPTAVTPPSTDDLRTAVIVDVVAGQGEPSPRWPGAGTRRALASIRSDTGVYRATFFAPGEIP